MINVFLRVDYLDENDTDRIYNKTNISFSFNGISSSYEQIISPFGGVEIMNTSHFVSDDSDAFIWFKDNLPQVNVPASIFENKIYLSANKNTYGQTSKQRYENPNNETIEIPVGESKFHVELEWRDRQVSYKLTMKNKRTGDKKTVLGKWFETTPTGKYSIVKDY